MATELLTTVTDTQAVGITTPFGRLSLQRWENVNQAVSGAFIEGVAQSTGLRETSYDSNARDIAVAQATQIQRGNNRNIAVIAIMIVLGYGLASGFNGGN